jgi:hypothetical protein
MRPRILIILKRLEPKAFEAIADDEPALILSMSKEEEATVPKQFVTERSLDGSVLISLRRTIH